MCINNKFSCACVLFVFLALRLRLRWVGGVGVQWPFFFAWKDVVQKKLASAAVAVSERVSQRR